MPFRNRRDSPQRYRRERSKPVLRSRSREREPALDWALEPAASVSAQAQVLARAASAWAPEVWA